MKNFQLFKRMLSVILALCMVSAWVMPAGALEAGMHWKQVRNDRVSANLLGKDSVERQEQEPEYADSDVVRVSIFLEKAGVLDAGFPVKNLAENAEAMAYRDKLEQEQETVVQKIEKVISARLDVVWNLTLASNLISANVQYGQIPAIEKVSGVRKVVIETVYEPQKTETADPNTATSGGQIGVSGPYAAGYTGAGTRIAVIDTGLDVQHQSFHNGAYLYALEQQADAAGKTLEQYVAGLNLLDAEEIASVLGQLNVMDRMDVSADDLFISEKIPFGFNYIDKNLNVEHLSDSASDHGSHVAGIAAANSYVPKNGAYVKALTEVSAQGVAPEAQVIVMKVFGEAGGAYQADYIAAMEDAILLNVDAINLSLGAGNPGLSYCSTAEYQAVFENLEKCGVVVSISAGNAGAWMDQVQSGAPYLYLDDVSMQTSGSPGTYTNSLGVASVDNIGTGGSYGMSSFSSWGVPANLILKPEITAPGGNILSVNGAHKGGTQSHDGYVRYNGTSMAAPHVAGMAALVAQYIRQNDLVEKTGLSPRILAQSLLMSTAVPIRDSENGGYYYPVLRQGAGLANVGNAVSADSYILMHADATASYADGKVKVELLDDPHREGSYRFSFTLYNLTGEAKQFALSADFFTQNILELEGVQLLDTKTVALTPMVTYLVNGQALVGGEAMSGMDFNGDGIVDSADGQALLDHVSGKQEAISYANNADLDGNGKLSSYDAYLFFRQLGAGGVALAGDGQAEITVEVTLSDADEKWLAQYENGAYLQGFVYAESEGGTSHSIPVLGYYGNWSDPSMYDKGSYEDYKLSGEETRAPYLNDELYKSGIMNGLLITYADDPAQAYYFGGNPMLPDATYMPERNAINVARGDKISAIGYTAIRNAVAGRVWVKNAAGAYLKQNTFGETPSAYYYVNGSKWENTYYEAYLQGSLASVENNTVLQMGLTLATEYYRNADGTIRWSELGSGAELSMTMVVDNTAPELRDAALQGDELVLQLQDNQYIASVVLLDATGQYVYVQGGSQAETQAGVEIEYALDVSDVNGDAFLLQVYDYAMNCTTYSLEVQIGEATDRVDHVMISDSSARLYVGQTHQLTAMVLPAHTVSRNVIWSSANEAVATVDENGLVTAVSAGRTRIMATSDVNPEAYSTCVIEVIDVSNSLHAILTEPDGAQYLVDFETTQLPGYTKRHPLVMEGEEFLAATMGPDGLVYLCAKNKYHYGSLYTLDLQTMELTKLAECVTQGQHIFFTDLTYAPAMFGTGALLGVYGSYVVAIDPVTGQILGAIDQYKNSGSQAEDLVGIAASHGTLVQVGTKWEYRDYVYLITATGTVIEESYYGYENKVVAYSKYRGAKRTEHKGRVDVGDTWQDNSAYYDGNTLFWAAYDDFVDEQVELYAFDSKFNQFHLGNFGENIYPVCGLFQDAAQIRNEDAQAEQLRLPLEGELQEITLRPMETQTQSGGQNAPETVRVPITAKNAYGNNVSSTNGIVTVTYDASKLTLDSTAVRGDYISVSESEGKVTFAYVSVGGLEAGDIIATLGFIPHTPDPVEVHISYVEINAAEPGFAQPVTVQCTHSRTQLRNATAPNCTESGYSGDQYCVTCGVLAESGKAVAPKGHYYAYGICRDCGEKDPNFDHNTVITNPLILGENELECGVEYTYRVIADGRIQIELLDLKDSKGNVIYNYALQQGNRVQVLVEGKPVKNLTTWHYVQAGDLLTIQLGPQDGETYTAIANLTELEPANALTLGDNKLSNNKDNLYIADRDGTLYTTIKELRCDGSLCTEVSLQSTAVFRINGEVVYSFHNAIEVKRGDEIQIYLGGSQGTSATALFYLSYEGFFYHPEGSQHNPYKLTYTGQPFQSPEIPAGSTIWYLSDSSAFGCTLRITGENVYVKSASSRYVAKNGVLEWVIDNARFEIGNDGTQPASFTVEVVAPLGTDERNPQDMVPGDNTVALERNETWFYDFVATEDITLTLTVTGNYWRFWFDHYAADGTRIGSQIERRAVRAGDSNQIIQPLKAGERVVIKLGTMNASYQALGGVINMHMVLCNHANTALRGVVAASCSQEGYSGDTYCADCGTLIQVGSVIEKLSHTEEILSSREATCTEDGITEGKQCSVCGEVLTAQEVIPAHGHSYDDWYVEVMPTCTETGIVRRDCQNCDHAETGIIRVLEHKYVDGKCIYCGAQDPNYQPIGLLGDLNGNGEVNSVDVNLLFRYLCGDETLPAFTETQLLLADVNQDGEVNSTDVNILFRYVSRDATLAWKPEELLP